MMSCIYVSNNEKIESDSFENLVSIIEFGVSSFFLHVNGSLPFKLCKMKDLTPEFLQNERPNGMVRPAPKTASNEPR